MEYEKESFLAMESLTIKAFKSKKKLWDRSNFLFEKFNNRGQTIRVGLSSCIVLGMVLCLDGMFKGDGFSTQDMILSGVYFLSMLAIGFMGRLTSKIVDSKSWIYRYIKKPKELIEMDTLRDEWYQALHGFSPLLEGERVQFEILKDLNTNRDMVGVSSKPEYERLIGWLIHYFKNKDYHHAAVTLLNIYELLEKEALIAQSGDYYQELNKKFTLPSYQDKL